MSFPKQHMINFILDYHVHYLYMLCDRRRNGEQDNHYTPSIILHTINIAFRPHCGRSILFLPFKQLTYLVVQCHWFYQRSNDPVMAHLIYAQSSSAKCNKTRLKMAKWFLGRPSFNFYIWMPSYPGQSTLDLDTCIS